jgi:DNA-binding transcriptional LysR family regulator
MEFRELKIFQVVASMLSFHKAAKILHYAQSTVSSQIRSLENDLGSALFSRRGNAIQLTKVGISLLGYTQKLVNIEKEIKMKITGMKDPYGSISIKAPQSISTYLLPSIFKDFMIMFPNVSLDIDWCTHYSLKQAFQSDITDVAFLITDQYSDPILHSFELCSMPLTWIVNPASPLVKKKSFKLSYLKDQLLLIPKADCSYDLNLQRALLESQIEPRMKLTINSLEAIKQIISTDQGIALMPNIAVKSEIDEQKLSPLNWQTPEFETKLYLVWKKGQLLSPPIEAFIAMVKALYND